MDIPFLGIPAGAQRVRARHCGWASGRPQKSAHFPPLQLASRHRQRKRHSAPGPALRVVASRRIVSESRRVAWRWRGVALRFRFMHAACSSQPYNVPPDRLADFDGSGQHEEFHMPAGPGHMMVRRAASSVIQVGSPPPHTTRSGRSCAQSVTACPPRM